MKKKALIVTTVSGFVPQFEMDNVHILMDMGYEIHYASNFHNPHYGANNKRLKGTGIFCHQVDFVRSPFLIGKNKKAFVQLKELLKREKYDILHCHTPMGGALSRLAVKKLRREEKLLEDHKKKTFELIYTAHGFHFYRGAPLLNWLLYYPAERWLAHETDILITINKEDFERAKCFSLRENGKVKLVNGIGIEIQEYQNFHGNRQRTREQFSINKDDFIFLSVGELSKRKNHQVVIHALSKIKKEFGMRSSSIRYVICGEGKKRAYLEKLAKRLKVSDQIVFTGYQKNIKEILSIADCFIFPSIQEGLPVAFLEAAAMGLFCIGSDIRGNRDIAEEYPFCDLIPKNCSTFYKEAMLKAYQKNRQHKSEKIQKDALQKFDKRAVIQQMKGIYRHES